MQAAEGQHRYLIRRFYKEVVPILIHNNRIAKKVYIFLFINSKYKYFHSITGTIDNILPIVEEIGTEAGIDVDQLFTHCYVYSSNIGHAIDFLEENGFIDLGNILINANIAGRRNPDKFKKLLENYVFDMNSTAMIRGIQNAKINMASPSFSGPQLPNEVMDGIASFAVRPGRTRRASLRRAKRSRRNRNSKKNSK